MAGLVGVQWRARRRLLSLVWARLKRFGADQDPATVLDPEAVAELTALLDTVPDATADLGIACAAGWLYWCRYLVLPPGDDQQDLADALALFAPVYQARPDAVPDGVRPLLGRSAVADDPQAVADRAAALRHETLRTGDRADMDAAIDLLRQAVAATPTHYPGRAGYLFDLGLALQTRFEWIGDRADLDAAIDAGRRAVAATPAGHPDLARYLSGLGVVLRTRFERTGDLADLNAAIDLLRQAAATPADDHRHATCLSFLGVALRTRFERIGDRADLDAAINAGRQAVAATPVGGPGRAMYLSFLGGALRVRFERAGDRGDLDAAIDAGRQAMAATPVGDPGRAGYLASLGGALRVRFERTGARADLDAAIGLLQQAVSIPAGDADHAMYLSALGAALWTRFERAGDRADLDAAIGQLQQAAAISVGHLRRVMYLSALGVALTTRFERAGDWGDLDAAIDAGRGAVAATPVGHPDLARYLSNLGAALRTRFERTGDRADLDAAIDAGRRAVAATPTGHPDRAGRLTNLGNALRVRFEGAGEGADLDAAVGLFQQAVAVKAASPRVRAVAACWWGRTAADGGLWQEAVAGFGAGAELLGLVAPRSLARADQEHLLEDLGSVGADAAACCVNAGLADRAVELFEQGRGVLLGQALDTRTDLTALAEQHPGLAARFTALRDDLDRAGDPTGPPKATLSGTGGTAGGRAEAARRDVERRPTAAAAFEQVIAEIRGLPGFGGFLRPPRVAQMLAAAEEGAVVVVPVSRFGSYALILTSDGVLDPVPLTGLTPETVLDRVVDFIGAIEDARSPSDQAAAEQRLGDTLSWLWDALAGPVLNRLGITGPPPDGQPWPRLWWCLSGLLSFLPVHAAGHHDTRADAAPATVIDRVIFSYTPTLRALIHARRPVTADGGGDRPGAGDRMVAVAMPRTPGASDLPGAQAEAAGLQRRLPGRVTVLTGAEATRDAVLAALPTGRWAHFACHGLSDLGNPSASRLLLADHRQRPLTVTDVARLRLDGAGLAFLSACSTGRPGGRLTDEAIHLASAFQLAGYRHVIATLWPVGDQHAVDLAAVIYAALTTADAADVAGAVHAAVRRMRRRWGWDMPSVWASHIHAGA